MKSRVINPKELIKRMPILSRIDLNLCVDCKAVKQLCGINPCPLISALDVYPDTSEHIENISGNTVFGQVPQIFIGSQGYPRVNTGPMTSLFNDSNLTNIAANPSKWTHLPLKEIINFRFGMLRGKRNLHIKPFTRRKERLYDQLKELTLSVNPVDTETRYTSKPILSPKFDLETQPMGPSGILNRIQIASNPKIPKRVDSIIGDELKAYQQMNELYSENYDVYYLQNILSSGAMGLKQNARLVPTKWAITATDDTIGKELIRNLRNYSEIEDIEIREGNLLGNQFSVIFLPGKWTFENFETWIPGGIFTIKSDTFQTSLCAEGFNVKEYYKGRTSYASQAGGYYASRLAVLEHLHRERKQARVVVIREISPEYIIPVGVWAVREGMRLTMRNDRKVFNSKKELKYWLKPRLMRSVSYYFNKAQTFVQTSLDDFF